MKLRLISLAAIAALAGNVFAAATDKVTQAEAAGAADVVYISGSSAAKGIIKGLFTQNCYATSVAIWNGPSLAVKYPTASSTTTISGSIGNIYACHVLATNDWGLPDGTTVVLNKRDFLGSGHGVFPVAQNVAVEFTDIAKCVDDTTVTCGNASGAGTTFSDFVMKAPDAGVSDLEPTVFNGTYNRPAAFSSALPVSNSDFGTYTPTGGSATPTPATVFAQVFGVAVTNNLYAEMQAAQGLTASNGQPSISSAQIANLLTAGTAKTLGWKGIATKANETVGVNICDRDIGSGTRATFNTLFLNNGNAGLTPFLAKPASSTATAPTDTATKVYINEAGSGGAVAACLDGVQTSTTLTKKYAIGLLGLGQGTDANYKFVKVDGMTPTRDAAKVGNYSVWVESTIQTNAASTASAPALNFLGNFIAKASYVDNVATVGAPAVAGVFATNFAGASAGQQDCATYTGNFPALGDAPATWAAGNAGNAGADWTAADALCSRYTRGGSSTKAQKFVK